jgi:DnaJ-domain-containing protein 1
MRWYGKTLGGIIGLILTKNPFGAALGVLMGHVLDENGGELFRRTVARLEGLADESESIEHAYRVLGITATASDDDVKKAYRRLMNEHHPDKLAGRAPSEAMLANAEQKTHEVRAAYEKVKAQRGFK